MCFDSGLRRIFAHAVYAVAAFILSLGPSVDAGAGVANAAVEAGASSSALKLIAAFDVIDDTLDHLPGKSGEPQQQQLMAPISSPMTVVAVAMRSAEDCGWASPGVAALASCVPDRLDRPPRA